MVTADVTMSHHEIHIAPGAAIILQNIHPTAARGMGVTGEGRQVILLTGVQSVAIQDQGHHLGPHTQGRCDVCDMAVGSGK